MKTLSVALLVMALGGACASTFARESATSQEVYTRQHDVLAKAIREGRADGVMRGDVADLLQRQFRSNGLVLVSSRVIKSFPRKDCKRLETVYTQKDVDTLQGRTDVNLSIQLNYCLDGLPPTPAEMGVKEKP